MTRMIFMSMGVAAVVANACYSDGSDDRDITDDTSEAALVQDRAAPTLGVTNFAPNTVVGYNLPIVRGRARGSTVAITSNGETVSWPVVGGVYKALVPLAPGANSIALASASERVTFPLVFVAQTTDHIVRPLWIEAADGDGSFEAPAGMSNTAADGAARLQIAAWMWQSLYAEAMLARGRGRTTFALQLDGRHRPVVTTARSTRTLAQLRAMGDVDIWNQLYSDFGSAGGAQRESIKDAGVLSFSHYVAATRTMQAGGALGGGHQATMHGADVWTWPATLAGVVPQFLATAVVDPTQLCDDSAGRGTVWANDATTAGALLHELGHTLGFPHDQEYTSIMYRGFDTWNRYFMTSEPPAAGGSGGLAQIQDTDLPVSLVDYQAAWLAHSPWFTQTPPPAPGAITVSVTGDTLTIASSDAVRDVMFWDHNLTQAADVFDGAAPRTVTYSVAALHARFPAISTLGILVEGDTGQSTTFDVP